MLLDRHKDRCSNKKQTRCMVELRCIPASHVNRIMPPWKQKQGGMVHLVLENLYIARDQVR